MTGRHHTDLDDVPPLLAAAVRLVAGMDAVTVKDVREGLGCARGEADQALSDLGVLGLVGPAARGRRRPVLFNLRNPSPGRSMPDVGWREPDVPSIPDDPADDPGATETVEIVGTDFAGLEVFRTTEQVPASPFSDPVVPPDPFTDSDGNQWPTRDPFGPVDF